MRTKKTIILHAVNQIENIESKTRFKILLKTKDGKISTITLSLKATSKKSVRDRVISEARKIMLNIKKTEGRDGKDERLYKDLSLKNIESLYIQPLE